MNPITTTPPDLKVSPLSELVLQARDVGRAIDLDGIGYGRIHWDNASDVIDFPLPYYYFLAGVVRVLNFTRVLEIGTHWGGATRSMWQGISDKTSAKVVTVDITTESDARLNEYPGIEKVVGDANSEAAFAEVMKHFDGKPIDLLYIDAEHSMMPLLLNFSLYAIALRPKLIVMDDVTWSEGMRNAWSILQLSIPKNDIVNVAEIDYSIRPGPDNPGFGMVRIAQNL